MRTTSDSLGNLLFGQTRGKILALLYGTPDRTFFIRQIARQIGTSVGTVQRELETLAQVGLIRRSVTGKQVHYQADREHPAFAELHSLVAKTFGIYQLLRSAVDPLAERISFAFVYGSMAQANNDAASDVDLIVIGDVTMDEVLAQLTPIERILGRPINPTVYSLEEFKSKLRGGNHFVASLMRSKKVILLGDEDELENLG
jgi:predicted nucleotidyltransferase